MTLADPGDVSTSPWAPEYRLPSIGLVIVITVVAIEAISVATVMPTVARSLHGLRFYSWGFTAYLLADVVGMVDAGRRCDRSGPAKPLIGGLTVFAAGLIGAATAPNMAVFIAARVLQGLGGGGLLVAIYVVIARGFPERMHRRVFAVTSSAWVVPSLVGPAAAGLITAAFGWRWVFAGIAPIAVAGALLLVPVLKRIGGIDATASTPHNPNGITLGLSLAAGLALWQAAAELASWWSLVLIVGGFALSIVPLRRLLPTATLRLARGLPTVVALRGIVTCAFFGAESYLPLTLARIHHGTPRVVGIPLTVAALGWTAGSWWGGHHPRAPATLLRLGFTLVAIGVSVLSVMTVPSLTLWAAVPIWAMAGLGMGCALPTISVLLLELSPADSQGAHSAALQISDMVGSIIGVTVVGAIVTAFGLAELRTSVIVADLTMGVVALCGAVVATRAVVSSTDA